MSPKHPFRATWGLTREAWDSKRDELRGLLTGVAASRATITYGEISELVFDRHFSARSTALAQMLEEVCTIEDGLRHTMLGSVVVRADTGIPGKGYFTFAADKLARPVDPDDAASCRAFWKMEVDRVWDVYEALDDSVQERERTVRQ